MTARWPTGCLYTASSITVRRHASSRLIIASHVGQIRQCAQKQQHKQDGVTFAQSRKPTAATSLQYDTVKSAFNAIESKAAVDPINPPRSTLPPPLVLPTRGGETVFVYYFRIGRAYATFYKDGIKAVWYNFKASRLLKERITNEGGAKSVTNAVAKSLITRSEFQLLARNSYDIGKLPLFGLLVAIFGEWLPLFVPFIPNAVPGTCRIPKQVWSMREKAEERRRLSFRQGITEPSIEQLPDDPIDSASGMKGVADAWPMAFSDEYRRLMLKNLRDDQLHHLSSTLGLHSRIWDRVQLSPPASLLRRSINKRLEYLSQDDLLLCKSGHTHHLSLDELHIACEERGLDILGKRDETLRESLAWWLKRQEEDAGWGKALFTMLFRRLAIRDWVKLNVKANQGV